MDQCVYIKDTVLGHDECLNIKDKVLVGSMCIYKG